MFEVNHWDKIQENKVHGEQYEKERDKGGQGKKERKTKKAWVSSGKGKLYNPIKKRGWVSKAWWETLKIDVCRTHRPWESVQTGCGRHMVGEKGALQQADCEH